MLIQSGRRCTSARGCGGDFSGKIDEALPCCPRTSPVLECCVVVIVPSPSLTGGRSSSGVPLARSNQPRVPQQRRPSPTPPPPGRGTRGAEGPRPSRPGRPRGAQQHLPRDAVSVPHPELVRLCVAAGRPFLLKERDVCLLHTDHLRGDVAGARVTNPEMAQRPGFASDVQREDDRRDLGSSNFA